MSAPGASERETVDVLAIPRRRRLQRRGGAANRSLVARDVEEGEPIIDAAHRAHHERPQLRRGIAGDT
jgi:hypothetical protein